MDHSAVSYEQTFCGEESEVILQWLNSQCSDQTMPMQPEFLNLNEDSSSNFLSSFDEFCTADPYNLHDSNIPTYFSFLPASLGNESYQQGMQCMTEDTHAMPYLDVGINQQHVYQAFTDEVAETGNALQLKGKRKLEMSCYEKKETTDDSECLSDNVPKKKSRSSVRAPRKAKHRKDDSSNGESSSCSSEDELTGESAGNRTLKNDRNGKSKASKGSATDSQSVYARKRREKINQRLRILQNLVPNGTKVDISTMLEEAVQYVKFLQTQIKLLSSDDLWMYAPLAYNGVNMNIDLSICQ